MQFHFTILYFKNNNNDNNNKNNNNKNFSTIEHNSISLLCYAFSVNKCTTKSPLQQGFQQSWAVFNLLCGKPENYVGPQNGITSKLLWISRTFFSSTVCKVTTILRKLRWHSTGGNLPAFVQISMSFMFSSGRKAKYSQVELMSILVLFF